MNPTPPPAPRVRSFGQRDADACFEICLRTADDGGDATELHADPSVVAAVWVAPYLSRHPECAVVLEDELGLCGYAVGAPDTAEYERWVDQEWFVPLRERYPLGSFPEGSADAACVNLIHSPLRMASDVVDEYPAHLHIDLLPRARRRGLGRRLMNELFHRLRRAGAPAVHLAVSPTNTNAVGFYEHLGFEDLVAGFVWGRSTDPIG